MGIQAPAEVKYELIHEAISKDNNLLVISRLCELAGVSRSGYYAWLEAASARAAREEQDKKDFDLILAVCMQSVFPTSAKQIHMRLLHMRIRMNLKKIRRLMKKFGLRCRIRRKNPYSALLKEQQSGRIAPNVIDRQFDAYLPREACLTDITYIPYHGVYCYLSVIKDVCTKEILAYVLSPNLKVDFVIRTVEQLLKNHGSELKKGTIIHSDQGVHYTSTRFIEKLKDNDFFQSMSRKANCWDNAPQESFFGHMKDEISEMLRQCKAFGQVKDLIDRWMHHYNSYRCQWELAKLTPNEYYEYQMTGRYPLAGV